MASTNRTTSEALRLPIIGRLSPVGKTLVAVGMYAAWTIVTWLLEGRIQTFLRPEATGDRLVYVAVANILIGSIFALWVVREFVGSGFTTREALGFRAVPRTLVAALLGGILGLALYVFQQPPTTDPVVIANVFAQVLPVSIAEVVVCFVVVGGSVAALLRLRELNPSLADGVALLISSVLFGVYHFAHSPPFNTWGMVALLTIVGIGTGLIYFGGGSFYGALAFHNFMALFGIVSSLAEEGQLGTYQEPLVPIMATGIVAFGILVLVERLIVKPSIVRHSERATK